MRCAFLRRSALSKPEGANAGAPVEAGRSLVVLVCVVEGAVVHRIEGEITVIAPTVGSACLAPGSVEKMLLPRQAVQWICRESTGVTDLRAYRTAGCAEAERDISFIVGCDTSHPSPGRICRVGALLKNRPGSWLCTLQLEPANSRYQIGADRIIVEH